MNYRVPNVIHSELINWSRWCWLGAWPHPIPPSQCGSAEGEYRPPEWEALGKEEPVQRPIRPNERNARIVQVAWEAMEGYQRLALKAEYPGNTHEGGRRERANRLGLTVHVYETHLQSAVNRVEAAFAVRP